MIDNSQVVFTANTEEYREGLRYLNRVYSSGLVPQEVFSMDITQQRNLTDMDPAVVGGVIGMDPKNYWSDYTDRTATIYDFGVIPPLEGPNGVRQTNVRELITAPERFAITSSCEYPEIAIKWVDYLYSWEGSQNSTYGPEVEPGDAEHQGWFVPPAGSESIGGGEAVFGLSNLPEGHPNAIHTWTKQIAPWYQPIEWHSGQIYNPDLPSSVMERMYYDATTAYEPYKQDKSVEVNNTPIFFMTPENNAAILEFKNAINTYVKQAQAEFVTGVRNLDTDWDSYVTDLENYGLSQYVELYNQEYQAYLSR